MGDIELKNVWFKYPDSDEFVLKNLNLTIKEGEKIAIVGRTGSGKTSLVQLIPRLYDVTEGEVIIDGKNVKNIILNELRNKIGYVPQGTFLFSDTIGDNIAFGNVNATEKQIEFAAQQAMVKENILEFEKNSRLYLEKEE